MKKGFSLPLWVAGAAKSALKKLIGLPFEKYELIKIPNEKKEIKIEIHSVGFLKGNSHVLGISFAKSGLDLDITQNLEIWTIASLGKISFKNSFQTNQINIIAGSGVGINDNTSEKCISDFAKEVLYENLLDTIPKGFNLKLEIHISDVFSLIPTPDPATMFINLVCKGSLKEIFSKEAIVHISKFCVISRSKPDLAKEIPNACKLFFSKPTE